MEPEGSLQCTQQHAIDPCPKLDEAVSLFYLHFLNVYFYIIPSVYTAVHKW
jgi:hypothetical protein